MDNSRGDSIIRILMGFVMILMIVVLIAIIMLVWPVIFGGTTILRTEQPIAPVSPTLPATPESIITKTVAVNYESIHTTTDTLQQVRKLVIGVGNESAPYSYASSAGSSTFLGLEVELAKELERRWSQSVGKIDVEFVGLDITRRFSAVKTGRVDFTIAAVPNTPRNCQDPEMICTKKTYANDELKVLVRTSATQINEAMSVDAFCNYFSPPTMIGFITGTAAQLELPRIFSQCSFALQLVQYKEYTNREQAVLGVIKKEVAGYVTHGRVLEFYRLQSSKPDDLKVVGLSSVAASSTTESSPYLVSLVIVLNHNRVGLRDLLDLTMSAMEDDQTLINLYRNGSYKNFFNTATSPIAVSEADCLGITQYWNLVKDPNNSAIKPTCATK